MSAQNPGKGRRPLRKGGFSPAVAQKIRSSILLMRTATAVVGSVVGIFLLVGIFQNRSSYYRADATESFLQYSSLLMFFGGFILMFVLIRSVESNLRLTEEMHIKISREMDELGNQIQQKVDMRGPVTSPVIEEPTDEGKPPGADADPLDYF